MALDIVPVPCPRCGESQNQVKGTPAARGLPRGPVVCMVCQHEFSEEEYRSGLEKAQREIAARLAQKAGRVS